MTNFPGPEGVVGVLGGWDVEKKDWPEGVRGVEAPLADWKTICPPGRFWKKKKNLL
jgi:hypothetical protein